MAVNERNSGGANGDAERDPALERLYREAAAEAPPAHLDAAILAAARREVAARPRGLSRTLRRWHVPVSIAAVVVVSATLVILVREEEGVEVRKAQAPDVAMRRIERAAAPPAGQTPAELQSRGVRAVAPEPEIQRRQESRDDRRTALAAGKVELEDRARPGSPPLATPGSGAVATPPEAARERAAPALADAVPPGRTASAPTEPLTSRSEADGPQAKMRAGVLAAKVSVEDRPPVWRGLEKEPPDKWLARIEELRKEGREADVEEMLSEFKRRFPGHPVPPASR
jgi:hypothetical protein